MQFQELFQTILSDAQKRMPGSHLARDPNLGQLVAIWDPGPISDLGPIWDPGPIWEPGPHSGAGSHLGLGPIWARAQCVRHSYTLVLYRNPTATLKSYYYTDIRRVYTNTYSTISCIYSTI